MLLPPRPIIYEIHTFVWLDELSRRYGSALMLADVPLAEWQAIAALGADAVWLMGVWERSPAGVAVANNNPELQAGFVRALPDFTPEDNIGSAYCVRRYEVDARLGGRSGLAAARAAHNLVLVANTHPAYREQLINPNSTYRKGLDAALALQSICKSGLRGLARHLKSGLKVKDGLMPR
ncbi:hypothetical protein HC891_26775, partial [Candidatus Gracilibacteria bacterium]|nr:hypothetical protein [Candidatus Gracilibacteria bacterium]